MTDPADTLAALRLVVDVLEDLGVGYYVTGSLASTSYGLPRTTVDADLVADLHPMHVRPFCDALKGAFYVSPEAVGSAVARSSSFNVIHLDHMVKVDVFVLRDRPWDRGAFARRRIKGIPGGSAEEEFFLASPEDVVLAKLDLFRRGGEVSERQWTDVQGVLKVEGASLDADYLERTAADLGLGDLLRRAREESTAGAPDGEGGM